MDKVRFGRALGTGARHAAKSLMSAADAATAPDPRAGTRKPEASRPSTPTIEKNRTATKSRVDPQVVKKQARSLGRSVWSPFAKFSSVLWLEVTGTFFGIFAMIAGTQVWKFHAALRLPSSAPEARRLYVYIGMLIVFGYFMVSNFVRANRRQRR